MAIEFAGTNMSVHYPPYAAPWGRATREPTHYFDTDLKRSVPRSGFACTDAKCPHCTYMRDGVRLRHVRPTDIGRRA